MKFQKKKLKEEELLSFYKALVLPRMIEEKMLSLLRQGKISKWFSGIGQEAISVGCALALHQDEYMFTMHRNLGVFTTRNVPFDRLFGQWQGKLNGFTKGRDRSFHFGSKEHHIVGMISHLGPQLSLASGVALSNLIQKKGKVALAFTGDGGTSEGEFHEAMNIAAVWKLPAIFIIENNGYGLSTPVEQQYACEKLSDRAKGYGMEGVSIDGNNILEVYHTVKKYAEDLRQNPRPVLIECRTFRMRGHEEASGVKYVPQNLFDIWEKKDPIANFSSFLKKEGILTEEKDQEIREEFKKYILKGIKTAEEADVPMPDTNLELKDVYAPFEPSIESNNRDEGVELRMVDAISQGLFQAMEQHQNLVLMGQDIGHYGGVFKITDGFVEQFGENRVRNTPLCESGVLGAALGYHIDSNSPAMVEMQFADFVSCGMTQIANYFAKLHYRWGQSANVVVRMPTGGDVGAGPFHSQSNEAWFTTVPGLKVVYPSSAYDAKGLLLEAFKDPNPVLFFEHKALYRSTSELVPEEPYFIPFGKARIVKSGDAISIITYGLGVKWANELCQKEQINAEIIDLRTLVPLDIETVVESVKKTGRVVILHEDTEFNGIGGELSAQIMEQAFEYLDAPIKRVASLNTPVPFHKSLENEFLGNARLKKTIQEVLNY